MFSADSLSVGGSVLWILAAASFIALTLIILKLWQLLMLRPGRNASAQAAFAHLEKHEWHQASLLLKQTRNPRLNVLGQSIGLLEQPLALDDIRQECFRHARIAVQELQRFLRPLEVIATVAPLLGLFGTVLGMIEAFQAMEQAGRNVNPSVLSGGIWQALLTTAAGLAVAIPSSLSHSAFERYAEVQAHAIEDDLNRLFTLHASARHAATDRQFA